MAPGLKTVPGVDRCFPRSGINRNRCIKTYEETSEKDSRPQEKTAERRPVQKTPRAEF
jgi:hypothetical protein